MKILQNISSDISIRVLAGIFALGAASAHAAPNGKSAATGFSETMMQGYDSDSSFGMPNIANQPPYANQATRFGQANQARPQIRKLNEQPSPFIEFVRVATDKTLPIFGSDLFTNPPSTFAPTDAAQVNPDYVLGVGDQIQVKGWGMVDIDLTLTVERNGTVYLPRVGSVAVAGVKFKDLQDTLKKSVSRVFNNFELSASLLQTRAVQVYVVGNAQAPGSYTLSGMSTLLNALFASGSQTIMARCAISS